jgi:hypothetical protein
MLGLLVGARSPAKRIPLAKAIPRANLSRPAMTLVSLFAADRV